VEATHRGVARDPSTVDAAANDDEVERLLTRPRGTRPGLA
jgi:hypothetical protein